MNIKKLLVTAMFCLGLSSITHGSTPSTSFSPESATTAEIRARAVDSIRSPNMGLMDTLIRMHLRPPMGSKRDGGGLQIKNPVLSPTYTYSTHNDESPGGFDGDQHSAGLSFDFDIYDGWVTGAIYQGAYRHAKNNLATDEHLESHGVSWYLSKRFFKLVNAGIAYNHVDSDHHLSRSVTANLDSDSNGFTVFTGVSDRMGHWSWSTTVSYGYSDIDYKDFKDVAIGRFGWNGALNYEAHKLLTVGATFGYYNFILNEQINSSAQPDDDYFTIGPRLTVHPHEKVDWHIDFNSVQGMRDYSSFSLTTGVDILF